MNSRVAAARVSSASIAAIVLLLIIRGASDWSEAFAVFWYGLFALGFFSGLVAVGTALVSRGPGRRRLLMVALALPALVAVSLFVWLLATFPFS
jgi:hypothetical protein